MTNACRSIVLSLSLPLLAYAWPAAHGQTVGRAVTGFEEIVVTARKREERLQEVPVSIQAFSEEQIERLDLNDVSDVAKFSPSIIFDKAANPEGSSVTVRGLAPTRGRSSVAILVDGIDVTSEAVASPGGGILLSTRLLDIQRIEVVRGPHSANYGRSAFAGAIQYVTRDPGDELSGDAALGIGSDGRYEISGGLNGPLVPGLLTGRVSASYWTSDGFYRDQATMSRLGDGDGFGVAGTLLFTPTERLSFKARMEYFEDEISPEAQVLIRSNSGPLGPDDNAAFAEAVAGGVVSTAPFAIFTGRVPDGDQLGRPLHSPDPLTGRGFKGFERDVWRGSLIGEWDLGSVVLNSWTSYTEADSSNRQDFDQDAILSGPVGSQVDVSERTSVQDSDTKTEQFSQEFRLSSAWDFPLQMSLGGLYWTEDSRRSANTVIVACPPSVPACADGAAALYPDLIHTPDVNRRETDHWSAYGSLAWSINDQLKLTAEARYSDEDEMVIGTNCGLPPNSFGVICGDPFATSAFVPPVYGPSSVLSDRQTVAAAYGVPARIDTSNDYWTPRFTLEWTPRDNLLLYTSAAKGVKPGGTSTVAAGAWFDTDLDGDFDELQFDSEELWSYELGGKYTWLDGRMLTNVALFYQDYTNKQVVSTTSTPSGYPVAIIENAGSATIQGVEIEGHWRVTQELQLSLSYTYLDTEYDDFTVRSNSKSTILTAPGCTPVEYDGRQLCEIDLSGNELERAPKHSLVMMAGYTRSADALVRGTNWFTEIDGMYQSKRYIDQSNTRTLDGYWLSNLRTGLTGDRWEVYAYVDNLFDDDTVRTADIKTGDVDRVILGLSASTTAIIATLPDPRTYGIRTTFRF